MQDDKQNIIDELTEQGASYLAQLEDKRTRMPERYVQTLQKRVEEQIRGLEIPNKEESKPMSKRTLLYGGIGLGLAACFALLVMFFPFSKSEVQWEDFSTEELSFMLEESMDDFSDSEWAILTEYQESSIFADEAFDEAFLEEYLLYNYENQLEQEDLL